MQTDPVQAALDALATGSFVSLLPSTVFNAGTVNSSFTVPIAGTGDVVFAWTSDHPDLIPSVTAEGKVLVKIPEGMADTVVTLTVTATKTDATSLTKTIPITLKAETDPAKAIAIAAATLSADWITFAGGEGKDAVTESFTLPVTGTQGTSIAWTPVNVDGTPNSTVSIAADTGKVTITEPPATTPITVKLKSKVSKGNAAPTDGPSNLTVTVVPLSDAESIIRDTTDATGRITYASGDSAASVTSIFTLPIAGTHGTTIVWTSSNTTAAAVNNSTGAVTVTRGAADAVVNLDAAVTRGSASAGSQRISVTVKQIAGHPVTYASPTVAGSSIWGTPPSDTRVYASGATITVAANSGNLYRQNSTTSATYICVGWNSLQDGTGISYAPGATLAMGSSDITLYPVYDTGPVLPDLYISTTGRTSNSPAVSGSKQDPFPTVQKALDSLKAYNANTLINFRIAGGSYAPSSPATAVDYAAAAKTGNIYPNLYGSYNPATWTVDYVGSPTIFLPGTATPKAGSYFALVMYDMINASHSLTIDGITFKGGTSVSIANTMGVTFTNNRYEDGGIVDISNGHCLWITNPMNNGFVPIITIKNNVIVHTDPSHLSESFVAIAISENSGYTGAGAVSALIENNVIALLDYPKDKNQYGDPSAASTVYGIVTGLKLANESTVIRNNTFVLNGLALSASPTTEYPSAMSAIAGSFGSSGKVTIENNIVRSTNAHGCFIYSNAGTTWSTSLTVRNNSISGVSVPYSMVRTNTTGLNFASWTTGNTSDIPVFVNVASDWRLASSTPSGILTGGINGAGESPAWAFSDDADGATRPSSGGWSMGAYKAP
ncbi:MAG: immunoglobulin-like domain-containing protein [Rectinemataceae bacterium]